MEQKLAALLTKAILLYALVKMLRRSRTRSSN